MKNFMHIGAYTAAAHSLAPISATQGTAVSAAGSLGRTAVVDLPGSHPPREAPV